MTLPHRQGCPRAARCSEGQKWKDQVKAKLTSMVGLQNRLLAKDQDSMTSHLTSKEKLVYTITFKNKLRLMWSLPIYPSVHPCIYPCMHSSVHLSIHPSNHLSILSVPTSFSSSFSSFLPCFPSTYPSSWASQVLPMVKNLLANAGDKRDAGLIPGSGRFPWRRP